MEFIDITLRGGGPTYAWTAADGSDKSGMATEVNGDATIAPGTAVRAWRDSSSGRYSFQHATCR